MRVCFWRRTGLRVSLWKPERHRQDFLRSEAEIDMAKARESLDKGYSSDQ
jgi:hypothetical protein